MENIKRRKTKVGITPFPCLVLTLCILGMCLSGSAMTSISPCPPGAEDEMAQLYMDAIRSRGPDGSCDAACEQAYARMERRACELAASGVCYTCDPAVCSKYGITCTGTGEGPVNPPSDSDSTWIVVIGALVVIGAGIGIGVKVLSGKKAPPAAPSDKKEQKKGKEKVRYILQLSSDHLTVTPDARASLTVTTWKIVGDNPPVPAPEAAITLTVPPGNGGLSVAPAAGQGSLTATLSLAAPVERSPVLLTVTASVGKSAESAQVTVDIPQEYIMEFF